MIYNVIIAKWKTSKYYKNKIISENSVFIDKKPNSNLKLKTKKEKIKQIVPKKKYLPINLWFKL